MVFTKVKYPTQLKYTTSTRVSSKFNSSNLYKKIYCKCFEGVPSISLDQACSSEDEKSDDHDSDFERQNFIPKKIPRS